MLSDSCLGNKQKNTVLKATTVVTLDEKRVPAFCRFTFIDRSTLNIEQRALTSAIQFQGDCVGLLIIIIIH